MKRSGQSDSWRRYLEAEKSGREEEAEVALLEMFRSLAEVSPSAGFGGRVMARIAGLAPMVVRPSLFSRRSIRLALAASLVVAGLGVALVAPMLPPLAALVGPGQILGGVVGLVSSFAVRFASGVAVWQEVGVTTSALARVAANPTVAALLLFHLLLAAVALRGLTALASRMANKEGSPGHVAS